MLSCCMKSSPPFRFHTVEHAQELLLLAEWSSTFCDIHLLTHTHHPLHVPEVLQSREDRMGPVHTSHSHILSLWNADNCWFPVILAVRVGGCCCQSSGHQERKIMMCNYQITYTIHSTHQSGYCVVARCLLSLYLLLYTGWFIIMYYSIQNNAWSEKWLVIVINFHCTQYMYIRI